MLYDPKWTVAPDYRRQVFAKAADLMEQKGHAKLKLQDGDGHVCVLGAMMVSTYGRTINEEKDHRSELLWWHVGELCRHLCLGGWTRSGRWQRLVYWNNAPERTQDEVVAALRACANRR